MKALHFVLVVVLFIVLFDAPANATNAPIKFRNCAMLVNKKGGILKSPSSFRIVFSQIVLGSECGTVQNEYLQGKRGNNALSAGMKCKISAVLKTRNGRRMRNVAIAVKNDVWTTRTSGRTNANGEISLTFSALASAPTYVLLGPKITKVGYLACRIYNYDHMV